MSKIMMLLALITAGFSLNSASQTPVPQASAASTAPVNVMLADGTPVKLLLGTTAAANGVRIGENLELEVADDVRVGDVVVIAKGSPASVTVTNLRSGASNGHGWIDINLESVMLANGHHVRIRASKNKPFREEQSTIISTSGQDASIAQGTDLTTYIDGNQPLDLTRLVAAGGTTTEVRITSTPSNAEVTVDGRVAGITPYTLRAPTGEHVLVLRMAGFQPWQRKVRVAAEPVTIDVPLLKQDGTEATPATKAAEPPLGDLARAARAHKPRATVPTTWEQDGPSSSGNQAEARDPMQPTGPKQ